MSTDLIGQEIGKFATLKNSHTLTWGLGSSGEDLLFGCRRPQKGTKVLKKTLTSNLRKYTFYFENDYCAVLQRF